jgi:putative hemolysin
MSVLLLALGVLLGIAMSAFAAAAETGSYTLNRLRLRVRSEQGDSQARRLDALMRRHEDLVISLILTNVAADYLATVCTAVLLLRAAVAPQWVDVYTTAILTPLLLVYGAMVPKDWFQREADRWMYPLALPLRGLVAAARGSGLVWALRALPGAILRVIDPDRAAQVDVLSSRGHVERLLHEGAARGGLSEFQRDTMGRIMGMSVVRLGTVMVPRERAAMVPIDIPRDDFLRIARMSHFSRLPVYRGDPRRVVGVVSVFDVLTDAQRRPITEHLHPPLLLSAELTVSAGLIRLQRAHQFMAIIVNRREECVGLLTMKDLAEEIVGELEAW